MFAWAKNAPPTVLPKGVGFKIDTTKRRYLVLQVVATADKAYKKVGLIASQGRGQDYIWRYLR